MSSDDRPWYRDVAIAMCTIAIVLISSFLSNRFLQKKIRRRGSSSVTDLKNMQTQQQIDGSLNSPSSSGNPETGNEIEVFLSSEGTDIRKKFTDYLYHSLIDAGVRTFRDNEELHIGKDISSKLVDTIKQSKIGIPIFSTDFASNKWCLMEVAEMVKSMKQSKQLIMPVFFDVTPDEVQHQRGSYADSFSRHEKKLGREKVRGWRDALKEVVKLKGLELAKVANGHQGELIKLITAMVIKQLKKSYLEMGDVLVGIEDRAEEIMNRLEVGLSDVRVVGVWGMGGIGKTTLAKFVYNQIVDNFESGCLLKDIRITSRSPKGLQSLQSRLVSDILRRDLQDYSNVEEGIRAIKERLRYTKALILLDDVDHVDQIKALAADVSWFGRGSRIIVTTREKRVLDDFHVQDPYEVPLLDKDRALELFCKHAFRDRVARPDYHKEAWEIMSITGGLPLALEVIGSFLCIHVGRKDVWNSTMEKLKMKPDMDVRDKLTMSYESLGLEEKEIFLDIACFFVGMDFRLVTPMWADVKFMPEVGIEILQMKSLIKIGEDNAIWMHDQLRDLGRSIVDQEDKVPGCRSRLWNSEEAMDVLLELQGTSKLEAISIDGYEFTEEEEHLNDQMFRKLSSLRVLELARASLNGKFKQLFNQLRWLSWHREGISPPEDLALTNLIVLDLSRSLIDERWIGWSSIKIGLKLKVINLSKCCISRAPGFSSFPCLESLSLESCEQLICLDPSIGLLKNLKLLNLRKCNKLRKLPKELGSLESLVELLIDQTGISEVPELAGMKKLEVFSADGCTDLHELPQSIGSLVNLKKLSLRIYGGLPKLPDSIGKLTSLVELNLSYTRTRRLPEFVGDLHCLESLKIDNTYITGLPGKLSSLKKLRVLDAYWLTLDGEREISDEILSLCSMRILKFRGIKTLPENMSTLSCLQTLQLGDCQNLQALPELPSSLVSLRVEASSKLTSLNLAKSVNLRELSLSGDFELKEDSLASLRNLLTLRLESVKIRAVPNEIGAFVHLKELYFHGCPELKSLPALPSSLTILNISNVGSLEELPDLSNLKQLSKLEVNYCSKIKEIKGLGNLTSLTSMWMDGSPLTNLDGIEKLEMLSSISVAYSEFQRIPDLSRVKNLQSLIVGGNKNLVEIRGLGSLRYLEMLVMDNCKSLKSLPELPKSLVTLFIGGCDQLCDIEAVLGAESLEEMDITECRSITKLPDLSKLPRLKSVIRGRIMAARMG